MFQPVQSYFQWRDLGSVLVRFEQLEESGYKPIEIVDWRILKQHEIVSLGDPVVFEYEREHQEIVVEKFKKGFIDLRSVYLQELLGGSIHEVARYTGIHVVDVQRHTHSEHRRLFVGAQVGDPSGDEAQLSTLGCGVLCTSDLLAQPKVSSAVDEILVQLARVRTLAILHNQLEQRAEVVVACIPLVQQVADCNLRLLTVDASQLRTYNQIHACVVRIGDYLEHLEECRFLLDHLLNFVVERLQVDYLQNFLNKVV